MRGFLVRGLIVLATVVGLASLAGAGSGATPGHPMQKCSLPARAVFWTASDWVLLGQEPNAELSPCVDYYISIPPLAADKTGLRVLQDDALRVLGPRVHPVAEVTLSGATGWAAWVAAVAATWLGAGIEFHKRMVAAGYRFDLGETWLLNEFDASTRRDQLPYSPRGDAGPRARALLRRRHRPDGARDRRDRHRLYASEHPGRRGLQGRDEDVARGLRVLERGLAVHLRADERGVPGHA